LPSPESDAAVRRRLQYTQPDAVSVLGHLLCAGNARGAAKRGSKSSTLGMFCDGNAVRSSLTTPEHTCPARVSHAASPPSPSPPSIPTALAAPKSITPRRPAHVRLLPLAVSPLVPRHAALHTIACMCRAVPQDARGTDRGIGGAEWDRPGPPCMPVCMRMRDDRCSHLPPIPALA